MRKIILYIAASLDGKIADQKGGVEWLEQIPNPDQSDYGYAEFYDSIDTTLMGNTTYQQVLGFGVEFPYKGKKNYVFSRNPPQKNDEHVEFVREEVGAFLGKLKTQPGKNIWCVGGAALNATLLKLNLIDEIIIFIMPVILGEGIPLTGQLGHFPALVLKTAKTHNSGVVELHYRLK